MGLNIDLDLETKSFNKVQTPGVYDTSITKVVRADKGERLPTGQENRIADDLLFIYLRVMKTQVTSIDADKDEHDNVIEVFFSDPDAATKDTIAEAVNRDIINFISSVSKKDDVDLSGETDPASAKKKEHEFRMQQKEKFKEFYMKNPTWDGVCEYITSLADDEHFVRSLTKPIKIKDGRFLCQLPTYDQNKFELVQKPYRFTIFSFDSKSDIMPVKPDTETNTSGSPMDSSDKKDDLPF